MGMIFSRSLKRKSTIETLEKLDNDIKKIEKNRANAQMKYKKITKYLLVYSVGLYVLCGLIFYLQFTSTYKEKTLLYFVPLALYPLLLYIIKIIISWYFVRLINNNQNQLNEMKKEKKRILEEVMNNETYKVAKQILEKFSGETAPAQNFNGSRELVRQPDDTLRKRIVSSQSNFPKPALPIKETRDCIKSSAPQPTFSSSVPRRPLAGPVVQPMRLPAPVLSLQRSYLDRIVEYLIGDGPNNRYALICSQCHSHNGMALKEEFEYISFKCCYCFHFNPARKVRPEAPKLNDSAVLKWEPDSESEVENLEEHSDEEQKNKLTITENGETSYLYNNATSGDAEPSITNKINEALEVLASDTIQSEESQLEDTAQESKDLKSKPENNSNCDESS